MPSTRNRTTILAITAFLLGACSPVPEPPAQRPGAAVPAPRSAPAVRVPGRAGLQPIAVNAPINAATAAFKRFALNALLVPLLDEDVPERWVDPSHSIDCRHGEVRIDGAPLDIGAPVGDAFDLLWRLDGCTPLGGHVELSGEIQLQVRRVGGRYSARIEPRALRVASSAGTDVLHESFDAELTDSPDRPR